jgi:hypothetical protein
MTTAHHARGVRPWAGAFFTLLAAALLAPGSSKADCIHDALRRTLEPSGPAHFRLLVQAGAMRVLHDDSAASASATEPADGRPFEEPDPGLPRPCSGPTCSNDSGVPTAPPASLAPAPGTWACLDAPRASEAPGSRLQAARESRPRARWRGPSIFHPPRSPFA